MNGGFQEFMTNMGVMCETWTVTYQKFIEMGFDHGAALEHTKGLMTTIIAASLNNGGNNGT